MTVIVAWLVIRMGTFLKKNIIKTIRAIVQMNIVIGRVCTI